MKFTLPSLSAKHLARVFRVGLVVIAVAIVFLHELIIANYPDMLSNSGWTAFRMLVIGVVAYAIATWGVRLVDERLALSEQTKVQEQRLVQAQKRQEGTFRLSRTLVEANDEEEIIQQGLGVILEVSQALGASFVPFNEREQPRAAYSRGSLPHSLMDTWSEHLASQQVTEQCIHCQKLDAGIANGCPMLAGPFAHEFPEIHHIHCLALYCAEHKIGMITLYLAADEALPQETTVFLQYLVDEMAIGLESVRLRKREIGAIQQLQSLRQKTDLQGLLTGLLEHIQSSMDADFAILMLVDVNGQGNRTKLSSGKVTPQLFSLAEGLMQGVSVSKESVFMGDVAGSSDKETGLRAMLAAPLMTPESSSLGAIMIGTYHRKSVTHRQLALLETIAGHVALVVNNASLLSELEYKTMLDERMRLAREIHDGLAQTLGFLKLQVAQMQNLLSRGDYEKLSKSLETSYSALANAYSEVRDAIDGLRVDPSEEGPKQWLDDLLVELEESTGIHTHLEGGNRLADLSPEVQIQLIRIIQEATSNVRKHAHAQNLWIGIACQQVNQEKELVLEIQDDGHGFSPEDISSAAQYGLRGMRERAELIGADYQVISKPHQGTRIRLSLLLPMEAG
jgi:two-component system, NarL family, nitrate/nitrite sensor histidine kinase NarX